jgi:hypothetical protein
VEQMNSLYSVLCFLFHQAGDVVERISFSLVARCEGGVEPAARVESMDAMPGVAGSRSAPCG